MALNLNPTNQKAFYEAVFGAPHPVTARVGQLIDQGVLFETSLYMCKATIAGKVYQVGLTKGSTTLMKHQVSDPVELAMIRNAIETWVMALPVQTPVPVEETYSVVVSAYPFNKKIEAIKQIRIHLGLGLKEAKEMIEKVDSGATVMMTGVTQSVATSFASDLAILGVLVSVASSTGLVVFGSHDTSTASAATTSVAADTAYQTVPPLYTTKGKITDSVVKLRDAQAVGQKVHGTSASSVYRCIAVHPDVKLAARIQVNGAVSIRAEWPKSLSSALKAQLLDAGMSMNADYASTHLNGAGMTKATPARIIGAFVMGIGVKWQEAVSSGSELVVG